MNVSGNGSSKRAPKERVTSQQAQFIRDTLPDDPQEFRASGAAVLWTPVFDLDSSLRGLFKTDMLTQSKKLTDTLSTIADSLGPLR